MLQEERVGIIAFGSTLDRKLFPLHVPPNRSGNEHRLKGDPHLGPGNYNNHEVGSVDIYSYRLNSSYASLIRFAKFFGLLQS